LVCQFDLAIWFAVRCHLKGDGLLLKLVDPSPLARTVLHGDSRSISRSRQLALACCASRVRQSPSKLAATREAAPETQKQEDEHGSDPTETQKRQR